MTSRITNGTLSLAPRDNFWDIAIFGKIAYLILIRRVSYFEKSIVERKKIAERNYRSVILQLTGTILYIVQFHNMNFTRQNVKLN